MQFQSIKHLNPKSKMNFKKAAFPTLLFLLVVITPTVIASVYYVKYASEQFTTESRFIIQSSNQQGGDAFGIFNGLSGMSPSLKDSFAFEDYILSGDFLSSLSKNINIKEIYSQPSIDWWAKLPNDASNEDTLEYWRELIEISSDSSSGITTLEVMAFSREVAVEISEAIIEKGEKFVNSLSQKARQDAVDLASSEVIAAETALADINQKIYLFNSDEKVINPQQKATSEEAIVSGLSQKLADTEAELTRLSSFMQSNTMKVRAIKSEIASIKTQILRQQDKWKQANPKTGKSVTTLIQDTTQFSTELILAEKVYESAITGLRIAKREFKQQQRYLEVIVSPQLPDAASSPEKISSIATVFLSFFMGWGIISLLIASVKDHLGWV